LILTKVFLPRTPIYLERAGDCDQIRPIDPQLLQCASVLFDCSPRNIKHEAGRKPPVCDQTENDAQKSSHRAQTDRLSPTTRAAYSPITLDLAIFYSPQKPRIQGGRRAREA